MYKRPVKEKPLSNFNKINCAHFIMCTFWKEWLNNNKLIPYCIIFFLTATRLKNCYEIRRQYRYKSKVFYQIDLQDVMLTKN